MKLLRIMISKLQNMQKAAFLPVIFVPVTGLTDDPSEERRRDGARW